MIAQSIISNDAEELTPAARITFVDRHASKPESEKPRFKNPRQIPASSDRVPAHFGVSSSCASESVSGG